MDEEWGSQVLGGARGSKSPPHHPVSISLVMCVSGSRVGGVLSENPSANHHPRA